MITPAYLLVYELLWTPQDKTDSLSHDQLVEAYPDLTQSLFKLRIFVAAEDRDAMLEIREVIERTNSPKDN